MTAKPVITRKLGAAPSLVIQLIRPDALPFALVLTIGQNGIEAARRMKCSRLQSVGMGEAAAYTEVEANAKRPNAWESYILCDSSD